MSNTDVEPAKGFEDLFVTYLSGAHILTHVHAHTHTHTHTRASHVSLRGRLVADMGATNGRASPRCPRVTGRKRTALPQPFGCERKKREEEQEKTRDTNIHTRT